MSHVIDYAPDALESKVRHIGALKVACDECIPGLTLKLRDGDYVGEDGKLYDKDGNLLLKGNMPYRTWISDHGSLAHDYPVPKGMKEEDIGKNAVAVIAITDEEKQAKGLHKAYEVGVIPHLDEKTGEVTYSLCHDFWAQGYGLEQYVGQTVTVGQGKVKEAHGNVLMFYQMMAAKIAAEEAGHSIEFEKQKDGSYEALVDKEGVGIAQ